MAADFDLFDLTDKGKMFLIIFQTFAYTQIFNILNARRPSYKDINPVEGISILTCVILVFLLGFQFCIAQVPLMLGYGTIPIFTNLLCMGIGAGSVAWFVICKFFLLFILGGEDSYASQA